MAVRIGEVDAAAAVVAVDLAGPRAHRVCPVLQLLLMDTGKDGVEIVLADEKA